MRKRIWLSAPFVALALTALVATRSEGKLESIEQVIPEQKLHVENSDLTTTSAMMKSKRISTEVCESAEGPARFTTIA